MSSYQEFIEAYQRFRRQVDLKETDQLPDLERLTYTLIVGIPDVPADHEMDEDSILDAIDQRVAILKAIFVEANRTKTDEFLDRGLLIYDRACEMAKQIITESGAQELTFLLGPKGVKGY